jgi:flagellar hook-associated protein 1 FlgK
MTLIGSISYNSQALQNQSAALSVTGNNLANVNNENYVRQRLTNSTTAAEGSVGLERYTVEQVRDAVLDASIVAENGELGELEAESKILEQLNTLFSESIQGDESTTLEYSTDSDNSGLTATLDSFYSAWSDLASDPTSDSAKEVVYQTAQAVVDSLNALSSELDDLEDTVSSYISEEVDNVNSLTSQIADLNDQIVRAEMGNSVSAADLRNQRQSLLEELGGIINVDYTEQDNGSVTVTTTDSAGDSFALVSGDDYNELSNSGGVVMASGGTVTVGVSSGTLKGYSDSLSNISDARSELNSMVSSFVTSVNTAYASDTEQEFVYDEETGEQLFDEETGEPLLTPDLPVFFDETGLTAATISIDSSITSGKNILSDFSEESGNDIAKAVSELSESKSSFQDSFITLSTSIASDYAETEDLLEGQELINEMLAEQRSSISGVNLNEEVTNMMVQQRAFQASSRVINVLDQLLSTVVNELM